MAHWAEIGNHGVVLRVTVGGGDDADGGYGWLVANLGGAWVETSFDGSVRKNYAAIGDTYDVTRDAFIPSTPYASWVLDEGTCQWVAPTPKPDGDYVWDEQAGDWVEA
jgi:hypothetical protein